MCSCIESIKQWTGHAGESWGNAWNVQPEFFTPRVGAMIITSEGRGHVGLVTGFDDANVYIHDANYVSCRESNRSLPLNSPLIRGYKAI